MTTGLIGTSSVPFNTLHATGSGSVCGTSGATLSYTCPASGVRYAVVTICASVAIGVVPAAPNNGNDPNVSAGTLRLRAVTGSEQLCYTVILAPGQSWTGKASSTVRSYEVLSPDTFAELTACVLEVA